MAWRMTLEGARELPTHDKVLVPLNMQECNMK